MRWERWNICGAAFSFFLFPPSRQIEDIPFISERSGRVREGAGKDGKSWAALPVKRTVARKSSHLDGKMNVSVVSFLLETSHVGAECGC